MDKKESGRGLYAAERRVAILSMLDQSSSVQVAEVAEAFGVSRVTARADLDALEHDGKLRRTHGGAVSLSKTLTVSIQDARVNVNVEAKRAIAVAAAGLVSDGDSILVDSGTTALEFVRALGGRTGVTVVTDDFTIADFVDRSMPAMRRALWFAPPTRLRSSRGLRPETFCRPRRRPTSTCASLPSRPLTEHLPGRCPWPIPRQMPAALQARLPLAWPRTASSTNPPLSRPTMTPPSTTSVAAWQASIPKRAAVPMCRRAARTRAR